MAESDSSQRLTKTEAKYKAVGKHCGLCSMFVSPSRCTLVLGKIDEDGVCDYFDLGRKHDRN